MERRTEIPIVAAEGTIDLHSSRALAARLTQLAGEPGEDAILDLTAVEFMDSIGLGVVLKAASRFARQDKRLVLVVPQEGAVRQLLDLTGTTPRLTVVADVDGARALGTP